MWIGPRRKPYVIGEIGFVVDRPTGDGVGLVREFSPTPITDSFLRPAAATVGMGCVEATNAEGFAFVRLLRDEELEEALEEFGFPELRFAAG